MPRKTRKADNRLKVGWLLELVGKVGARKGHEALINIRQRQASETRIYFG
jgi:hypothetical protein